MTWSPKDENDVADYKVDWADFLATGETVTNATVTVATGLTKVSSSVTDSGTSVTIRLSGGTPDTTYDITTLITTSEGQSFEVTKPLLVKNRIVKSDKR